MAKRKVDTRAPTDVTVMARASFRHHGEVVRTGETVNMTRAEADDLIALHMATELRPQDRVDG